MTSAEAIENACRLLERAELEMTNLVLMERLDDLAASWLNVAVILADKERV